MPNNKPKKLSSLLQPLRQRQLLSKKSNELSKALERLDAQALGIHSLSEIEKGTLRKRKPGFWRDPEHVKKFIELVKALYVARRISYSEYIYFSSGHVEHLHEDRWISGQYDELGVVAKEMELIESREGDDNDRKQYAKLNKEYEKILDQKGILTLREFGLDEIADLKEKNIVEFDQLYERGRRAIQHKDATVPALQDVVLHYEDEARKSASAKAFTAAVIAYGSGLEGLLILRCLKSKAKAIRIAALLPKKVRPFPQFADDPTRWTFENLIETCLAAGWFKAISTEIAEFRADKLAHILRLMRNNVHPGRIVRERPWKEIDEQDYEDVRAIYVTLLSQVIQ